MSKAQPQASGAGWWGVLVAIALSCAATSGCVATSVDPISDRDFKPHPVENPDESRLWSEAEATDRRIEESGALFEDEDLVAYLETVGRRLLRFFDAPGVAFRVRVVPDPYLNAFATPNGTIYVHTGLLARVSNEAQLAYILAHEISHYLRRHSLQELLQAKNELTVARVGSVVAAVLGGVLIHPGSLESHLNDVQNSGYSRELEREADHDALRVVALAGYDVREVPMVFEQLMEQHAGVHQPYFLGSHPRLEDRLRDVRARLADGPALESGPRFGDGRREAVYLDETANVLLTNADLNIYRGFRQEAEKDLERFIRVRPDSVDGRLKLGYFHKGRLSDPTHAKRALAAYRDAARIDPDQPAAQREIGLMLRGMGREEEARAALRRYLELRPDAVDRRIIERLLEEIESPESRP